MSLRIIMLERGLTLKDLGKLVGVQAGTMSKKLNGKIPFTLPEMEILSVKLGKSIEELRG